MCIFTSPCMLTIVSTNNFTVWQDHIGKWPPSLVFFLLINRHRQPNRTTHDWHRGQDSTNINFVRIFSLTMHRRYRSAFIQMNNLVKFVLTDRLIFLSTFFKLIQIHIDGHFSDQWPYISYIELNQVKLQLKQTDFAGNNHHSRTQIFFVKPNNTYWESTESRRGLNFNKRSLV
jgi:hypothetical protein